MVIPGTAGLHVSRVRNRSSVVSSFARSPLSLLTPRSCGQSVWAYTSSYGGGMVAGDQTRLSVTLDEGARCFLSTQASTKIYRNPSGRACSHHFEARLAPESLLVLAPDPVQCFAESSYDQTQEFHLAPSSNLVLVDWISGGRSARGERWVFHRYSSKNRIYRDSKVILLDSIQLDGAPGSLQNRFRTGRFNCLATLVMLGPHFAAFAAEALGNFSKQRIARSAPLIDCASALSDGLIIRLAGITVEDVGRRISTCLKFIPSLLHGDPWARKW